MKFPAIVVLSLAAVWAGAISLQVSAQSRHEGLYQVEMIVFVRDHISSQEQFPDSIKLRYPSRLAHLQDTPPTDGDTDNAVPELVKLPPEARTLNSEVAKLNASGRYRVLFHESWKQNIGAARQAQHLVITGGDTFGNHFELEGSIQLSVATYLKLSTNLWLSRFQLLTEQDTPITSIELSPVPVRPKTIEELEQEASLDLLFTQTAEESLELPEPPVETATAPSYAVTSVVSMRENRDMRSSEIHYLDNPKLGVLIKITPHREIE